MLADCFKERVKREDRRTGGVIAALYNIHTRASETDPIHDWQDYFPEWKEEQPIVAQTEDEMFETMKLLAKRTEGLNH